MATATASFGRLAKSSCYFKEKGIIYGLRCSVQRFGFLFCFSCFTAFADSMVESLGNCNRSFSSWHLGTGVVSVCVGYTLDTFFLAISNKNYKIYQKPYGVLFLRLSHRKRTKIGRRVMIIIATTYPLLE